MVAENCTDVQLAGVQTEMNLHLMMYTALFQVIYID